MRQCGTTRSQCDPPCANGGNCVDLGFEGLTDCGCVFPWGGDDCTKRSNYTLAHDGGTSPGSALDVVNKIRDETGVNSSDQVPAAFIRPPACWLLCGGRPDHM